MARNITLKSVSYVSADGAEILKGLSVTLPERRIGIAGNNGAGKATLLRIIAGELKPSAGQVIGADGLRITHLPQDLRIDGGQTVADALRAGTAVPNGRIAKILGLLGLNGIGTGRRLESLSGGERMRTLLAAALIRDPDFLLLDEPTNSLNAESRQFVYGLIRQWDRGLLVVSHDRELLLLVDETVELSEKGLRSYGGNYDAYRQQRKAEDLAAESHLVDARKDLKRLKETARKKRESQEKGKR